MEEHGHREDTVEAAGREAEPRAVAHGMDQARPSRPPREPPRAPAAMTRLGSTPITRPRGPTRAAASRRDDAGARADLEHALAAPDAERSGGSGGAARAWAGVRPRVSRCST